MVGDINLANKDLGKIKQIELEDNARRTLAQIVGGILGFAAIFIAWRRVEVANETQITDRFTKAIEQLANENLSIRLGGIYALARISRDSRRDHRQIMEVLTAFVREKCPFDPDKKKSESDDTTENKIQELPTDIQAILTIIVKKVWSDDDHPDLNLYKTSLTKVNLLMGNLTWANLKKTNLSFSDLTFADLSRASLGEANLSRAILFAANLSGAYLQEANLSGAVLNDANLSNADLTKANLSEAHFNRANLNEAYLLLTNLTGTDLMGANLTNAKNVTCDQINSAKIDKTTKLPDYLEIIWTSDTEYEIKEKSD